MLQVTHCVTISNPPPPRWNPPLPPQVVAWMPLMWAAGLTGAEIGAEFGMTRGAIYNLRLRLALPARPKLGLAHATANPAARRPPVSNRPPLAAGSASSWALISGEAWARC